MAGVKQQPRIHLTKTADGVSIAHWTAGVGPPIVITPYHLYSHVLAEWNSEVNGGISRRLAQRRSVVRFDGRGTGLSQRDRLEFSFASVRDRVEHTRGVQTERFAGTRLTCNAEMTPAEVREHCQAKLDEQAQSLPRLAMTQLGLSARAFHRVLKLARTITDMAGSETIIASHLAEAVQYRQRVRG